MIAGADIKKNPCHFCGSSDFLFINDDCVSCWRGGCKSRQAKFKVSDWGKRNAIPIFQPKLSPVIGEDEIARLYDPHYEY